jgi:hypothetical protein
MVTGDDDVVRAQSDVDGLVAAGLIGVHA